MNYIGAFALLVLLAAAIGGVAVCVLGVIGLRGRFMRVGHAVLGAALLIDTAWLVAHARGVDRYMPSETRWEHAEQWDKTFCRRSVTRRSRHWDGADRKCRQERAAPLATAPRSSCGTGELPALRRVVLPHGRSLRCQTAGA